MLLALAVVAGLIPGAAALASSAPIGSLVAADSSPCVASGATSNVITHQTIVTQHAGDDAFPELFTDKVALAWCTGGSGDTQILSSSQDPSLQTPGFDSVDALRLRALQAVGITFGITPASAPAPTIDNEGGYGSTTASGVSYTEDLNVGEDLAYLAATAVGSYITGRLAAELVTLIRSGQAGRAGTVLLQWWDTYAGDFVTWAKTFGLPSWAATMIEDLPTDTIVDKVYELDKEFASAVGEAIEGLSRDTQVGTVIDIVRSKIQQVANALDFTSVDWAPQITVTVSSLAVTFDNTNLTLAPGFTAEEPTKDTTPPLG